MAGREDMIAQAEKSLGKDPNIIRKWYMGRVKAASTWGTAWPWCNASVTMWAWLSGNQKAVAFGEYYAYTVAHANKFKAEGRWHVDVAGIARGDIVFFDWNGSDSIPYIDHVGIVTGTAGDKVLTIEGNTAGICARRVRDASTIAGYGRPAYITVAPAPKPKPPGTPALVPFPGEAWFRTTPKSPVVTAMGKRLVAVKCSRYENGPGPQWTDADRESYAAWQRKCGFSGADANGWPGKTTWDRLKVPK